MEKQQIILLGPKDITDWLRAQARLNSSSTNSETIRAIRERMCRVD
jgi:hypothetical protein